MDFNDYDSVDDACFSGLTELVHELSGITIKPEKKSMLLGRLRRRVSDLDLPDYTAYLEYVRTHKCEHELFINKITTNETYFFRTPRGWDYLETEFLPEWQRMQAGEPLNIWSAASSTGEEAHTLAILMQHFKEHNKGFEYRITGTDIDTEVVRKASEGIYKGRSIQRFREFKPDWFNRYMNGNDDAGYRVLPHIKSRITFGQFNLFCAPSTNQKFDLVLLRNVLIYFTKSDQEKAMATVHGRLKQNGVAIIGESESLNSLNTQFASIAPTIYKPIPSSTVRAA